MLCPELAGLQPGLPLLGPPVSRLGLAGSFRCDAGAVAAIHGASPPYGVQLATGWSFPGNAEH